MLIGLVILLILVGTIYYFYIKPTLFPIIEEVEEGFRSPLREEEPVPRFIDSSSSSYRSNNLQDTGRATLADLMEYSGYIQTTIGRLSVGLIEPATKYYIDSLMNHKVNEVDPMIEQVKNNELSEDQIPKMKSDLTASMKLMDKLQPEPASTPSSSSSSASGLYNPSVDRPATIAELTDFKGRIQAEMDRLSASGALDAITQQRIRQLNKVKQYVQQIMDEVQSKSLPENRIPIMKSSLDVAFKSLSSNSPLPDVFNDSQINAYLKGILPDNMADDPEVAQTIAEYLRSFTNNLSWNFGVKYVSNAERDLANSYNNRANQEGRDTEDANLAMAGSAAGHLPENYSSKAQVSDEFANTPQESCRGPASFDWKKRSNEICRALKARGLETKDYGCMPEDVEVGPAFSYKGYARMICTRVASNYDTGLGSLVGCPPLDWAGWRLR